MLLGETVSELCKTPFFLFNGTSWEESDDLCTLAVYDRFISDRAFGQKKRIMHTPGDKPLLDLDKFVRVGRPDGRSPVYIIESENPDTDQFGNYLNTYMLREVQLPLQVYAKVKVGQTASGAPKYEDSLLPWQFWCDLERYGVARSSELPVDYDSFTITTSRAVPLPKDCRLHVDVGYTVMKFAITERFDMMNSAQLRVRDADAS